MEAIALDEMYKRIEQLCREAGVNVTTMCREAGVPRSALSDYKAGRIKSLGGAPRKGRRVFHRLGGASAGQRRKARRPEGRRACEGRIDRLLRGRKRAFDRGRYRGYQDPYEAAR